MQVLWSRVAQTRLSCQCSSCLHAGTTAVRRTTSVVARRPLKFGDIFTACYSTILASAAVADAKMKDERRREWDRVIAEAREGRNALPMRPEAREGDGAMFGSSQSQSDEHDGGDISAQALNELVSVDHSTNSVSPLEVSTTSPTLVSLNRQFKKSLEGWVDEPPHPDIPFREPSIPDHLQFLETMVTNLVRRLLSTTNYYTASSIADFPLEMRESVEQLQGLNESFIQYPLFRWEAIDGDRIVQEQRVDLHTAIRSSGMAASKRKSDADHAIIKICYNLLVSMAPPSIVTMNILLSEFTKQGRHECVKAVIHAIYQDNEFKFAPTSTTVCLILDHHVAMNDKNGLRATIQQLRAVDGNGMQVGKKEAWLMQFDPVAEWATSSKITVDRVGPFWKGLRPQTQLIARMPRDEMVYDSLIRASLKLLGIRDAIRYIRAAFRENKAVNEQTFVSVVNACGKQLDYRGALTLLKSILQIWEDGNTDTIFPLTRCVRAGIYKLFALCGIVLPLNAQSIPASLSQDGLRSMVRYMKLESINHSLDRIATFIQTLNVPVDILLGDSKLLNKLSVNVTALNEHHKRLNTSEDRRHTLRVLSSKVSKSRQNLVDYEFELGSLIYDQLSDKFRTKYHRSENQRGEPSCLQDVQISKNLNLILRLHREQYGSYQPALVVEPPIEVGDSLLDSVHLPQIRDVISEQATPHITTKWQSKIVEEAPKHDTRSAHMLHLPAIYQRQASAALA